MLIRFGTEYGQDLPEVSVDKFISGQGLAAIIYVRNVMLIFRERRQHAKTG